MYQKIIKFIIYALVFLLPLFWLPFTFEAFEFNKQYLLFFLVSLALFAWLAKQVLVDKEIRIRKTPLDIFVLVFLFLAILSAVFSVDRISSLLGFYGRFSDSLIGLLSLGGLYFLITNNVQINSDKITDKHKLSIGGIIQIFSWSVFFVVLFSYFSIFGVWTKLSSAMTGVFPQVMLQSIFNPASGSMEGLTIFLAVVTVLFTGLLLNQKIQMRKLNFQNIFYLVLILACLGILEIIDFRIAWVVLLVGLSLYLLSALITRIFRENVNRLLLPIFLIIIAAVLLLFNIIRIDAPQEYVLGQNVSWQTAIGAATENIKSIFLGSGVGTYFYDFARFRPVDFNQEPLWYIGFDRSGSHFAEILGTVGFLGLLSYLALIGMFLIISWFLLKNRASGFQLPLLMAFLTLIVGQILYYQNITLAFTFWLMLGLGACCWQGTMKEKTVSFKSMPELSLVFSTLLVIVGAVFLVLYYFGASYYWADVNYRRGLFSLGQERIEKLGRAVESNPRLAQYKLAFSRGLFFEFLEKEQKSLELWNEIQIMAAGSAGRGQKEQEFSELQITMLNIFKDSIDHAEKVTKLQPSLATNWYNLGMLYGSVVVRNDNLAEDSDWVRESIGSFEKAIALEPTNPIIYTELGNFYMILENEQKAKEYFQKALDKKPYYAAAIIQMALLLEREEILQEAITMLEGLITHDAWNIEAHYQLGRLYYNDGRIDEAIELFGAVALVVPQHSNSLYSLGVAYTAKGQVQEAILVFERVLELNPGNQDVIQKLDELKRQGLPQQRLEEQPEEEQEKEESEESEEEAEGQEE